MLKNGLKHAKKCKEMIFMCFLNFRVFSCFLKSPKRPKPQPNSPQNHPKTSPKPRQNPPKPPQKPSQTFHSSLVNSITDDNEMPFVSQIQRQSDYSLFFPSTPIVIDNGGSYFRIGYLSVSLYP